MRPTPQPTVTSEQSLPAAPGLAARVEDVDVRRIDGGRGLSDAAAVVNGIIALRPPLDLIDHAVMNRGHAWV